MAKAADLVPGETYSVKHTGPVEYRDTKVTVISNVVPADGEDHQRKVLVRDYEGQEIWLLPRFIDDGTLTHGEQLAAAQAQPSPVSTATATDEYADLSDPMDPRLDQFRPDPEVVNRYISRVLPGGKRDTEVLLKMWRKRLPTLLVGDTQAGKTMLVNVLAVVAAEEAGHPKPYPVFTLSGSSGITDFDLFGQPTAYTDPETGTERLVWLPGVMDLSQRAGGFLYLDEINLMDERTTSSLHPVLDDRRMFINRNKPVPVPGDGFMPEVVNAHPEAWTIGTYNDGYRGAAMMNEAFINRFVHFAWGYDEEVENALVPSVAIQATGLALRKAREEGVISTPVGTLSLQRFCEQAYDPDFGVELAFYSFVSMFVGREQERVRTIVTERGFINDLETEVETHHHKENS